MSLWALARRPVTVTRLRRRSDGKQLFASTLHISVKMAGKTRGKSTKDHFGCAVMVYEVKQILCK